MIKLIVAIGPNGLIGNGDKMAWNIPAEFKHFKETTIGHDLLMGQSTFLGLPGKLPGRKTIVLGYTETKGADVSITSIEQLEDLFDVYRVSPRTLFISGGKSIYEQFYKEADELIISEVKTDTKGDVFLKLDLSGYKKTLIKENKDFNVYSYKK